MDWWLIADVILALGATIRLTRAVTVEDIGGRLLRWPAEKWVHRGDFHSWRRWWADALSCPWCVSTWLGIAAMGALAVVWAADLGWLHIIYRIIAGGLTLSLIAALILVAVDTDEDEWADEEQPAS